jgi:hypothetical protein
MAFAEHFENFPLQTATVPASKFFDAVLAQLVERVNGIAA